MLSAMSSDEKSGSQRAIKRPRVPPGPLADLKALLYQLYREAGTPRLNQIEKWAAMAGQAGMPGRDTVARIIGGATMPPSQADLVTVVTVLARAARWDPDDAARRARDMWVAARMDSARIPAGGMRVSQVDPRRLGVHTAISVPGVADEVPPEYVPRDADDGEFGLRAKVAAAAERGGFVLLVGGSSVGKSRCAFEAVTALLPDWWLVHPAGPGEIAELAAAPTTQTVVWLDELQSYMDGEHGLTGGVVRALLNAPDPAMIIGTIWPDRYAAYTTVPAPGGADLHAREREVLDLAEVVRIGPEFSPAEQGRARAAAARDRRLAIALDTAGYGLTQTLAAAPQLVARWEDAQAVAPYAWAVLTAALDVVRLGARAPLSPDLLRAAAPGYCTGQQQAEAPGNWFEQALAYATEKLHGAVAALRPVGVGMGKLDGYTAADYLIQHASRERRYERPPASIWGAVVSYVRDPADAARLADSARNRLLYRYAIPLYRHAADAGDGYAARDLSDLLERRGDQDGAEEVLRSRADADEKAASQLAWLLAQRGDDEGAEQILRAWADIGDEHATLALAAHLSNTGDLDGLRALANAGQAWADWRLPELLAQRVDIDGLRALANAGDEYAARGLVSLLVTYGDLDGLRARTDAGDRYAASVLVDLLARRGDQDGAEQILRARAEAGDHDAASRLASLLARRGDQDGAEQILRARAEAGDHDAASRLASLLARRGDQDGAEQILRARAEAGDHDAAWRLASLLARRGDQNGLRARADAGDMAAASRLASLLARRGDQNGLRARADAGDMAAASRLASLLADCGDLDGLRARADAGDMAAASRLAEVLAGRGDLDRLRARADADDEYAAVRLTDLLAERGDLDGLRARTDAGERRAAELLTDLLMKQSRGEEAERLRRFGLNPDGSIASA